MRYGFRWILFLVFVWINGSGIWAQSGNGAETGEGESANALMNPLPVDSSITIRTLDNGIRYYIRENSEPRDRAELRLVVNAGSILEDDDQQGLAHFVEHMAFNGTEHFEKQELVNYLEQIGMRFGPDVNAYTSFDETVYMLQIPTDSMQIVETAFQILEDWAHRIGFLETEIDKERGVVMEEWRQGRGAQARMRDRQFPVLFKGSRYAERLPIGKPEVIDTAHYETIRRFYQDWYRPDLMAVIAVGDFDKKWIESLIVKHFGNMPSPQNYRERVYYPVPGHEETFYAIATDPEATFSSVAVYYKKPVQPENTHKVYRDMLIQALYDGILNNRLKELLQQPDPPFLFANSGRGRFIRTREFYVINAAVKENGIRAGLQALLTEAARIDRYGVTPSELARQKAEMMRGMEQAFRERDKTPSSAYAAEYIRNYLQDEPVPGIAYEYQLYQTYIPSITIEEINQLADALITEQDRVVLVSAPEKAGLTVPDEAELAQVFREVSEMDIAPYEDRVTDAPLVNNLPAPGQVETKTGPDTLGVEHWQLSNGIRMMIKPTDFKNDQILFYAYSSGGLSLYPDSVYIAGATADAIVSQSGLGEFGPIELEKKLAGKTVSVTPEINSLSEGLNGNASPEDLETLFQLIYLYFTSPRKDSTAFLSYQSRIRGFLENRSASPEAAFRDTLQVTLAQNHFRARPWTMDMLKEMDLERSLQIYRERFADASDFTFIFVGNIDPAALQPLAEQYLASLPALYRREHWRDEGIYPPRGIIEKTVYKGLEEKSRVQIVFTGPFVWNRQNRYDLNAMAEVLRIRLRELLREDQGGTYGVGVSASPQHFPREEYQISIGFGCAPERVGELTRLVFAEIDSLKFRGVGESYLQKVRETQRREYEVNLRRNGYWLSTLKFYDTHQEPLTGILETPRFIEQLSVESVQKAAQKYLDTRNFVKVVLMPEKTGS